MGDRPRETTHTGALTTAPSTSSPSTASPTTPNPPGDGTECPLRLSRPPNPLLSAFVFDLIFLLIFLPSSIFVLFGACIDVPSDLRNTPVVVPLLPGRNTTAAAITSPTDVSRLAAPPWDQHVVWSVESTPRGLTPQVSRPIQTHAFPPPKPNADGCPRTTEGSDYHRRDRFRSSVITVFRIRIPHGRWNPGARGLECPAPRGVGPTAGSLRPGPPEPPPLPPSSCRSPGFASIMVVLGGRPPGPVAPGGPRRHQPFADPVGRRRLPRTGPCPIPVQVHVCVGGWVRSWVGVCVCACACVRGWVAILGGGCRVD